MKKMYNFSEFDLEKLLNILDGEADYVDPRIALSIALAVPIVICICLALLNINCIRTFIAIVCCSEPIQVEIDAALRTHQTEYDSDDSIILNGNENIRV